MKDEGREGVMIVCSIFSSFRLHPFLNPRQEGLEPPTDGFGDRYSTN
jgi:hypothetical protein